MATVTDWLNYANSVGVFSYVVPFLLIFAVVFGILKKSDLFGAKERGNNSIETIIAAAVGLLSLQFDMVGLFFSNIFPKMGVGLAFILVILIFLGFVGVNAGEKGADGKLNWTKWVGIVGAVLVTLWAFSDFWAFGSFGYGGNLFFWFSDYFWSLVILGLVIWAIVAVGRGNTPE
ncbi:MAG: hypothetical protein ACI83O_000755 [Patescibacteria group bacterium]|jgi:hypothetical protein